MGLGLKVHPLPKLKGILKANFSLHLYRPAKDLNGFCIKYCSESLDAPQNGLLSILIVPESKTAFLILKIF